MILVIEKNASFPFSHNLGLLKQQEKHVLSGKHSTSTDKLQPL